MTAPQHPGPHRWGSGEPHKITVRVFFGDSVTHDVFWNPTTERILRECYREDTPGGRQYSALHPEQQDALTPFVLPTRWHKQASGRQP